MSSRRHVEHTFALHGVKIMPMAMHSKKQNFLPASIYEWYIYFIQGVKITSTDKLHSHLAGMCFMKWNHWRFLQAGQVLTRGTIWSQYILRIYRHTVLNKSKFCPFRGVNLLLVRTVLKHILKSYMVGVWLSAVKNMICNYLISWSKLKYLFQLKVIIYFFIL